MKLTHKTYPDIGELAFGVWGRRVVGAFLYSELFCALVLFFILLVRLHSLIPHQVSLHSAKCFTHGCCFCLAVIDQGTNLELVLPNAPITEQEFTLITAAVRVVFCLNSQTCCCCCRRTSSLNNCVLTTSMLTGTIANLLDSIVGANIVDFVDWSNLKR